MPSIDDSGLEQHLVFTTPGTAEIKGNVQLIPGKRTLSVETTHASLSESGPQASTNAELGTNVEVGATNLQGSIATNQERLGIEREVSAGQESTKDSSERKSDQLKSSADQQSPATATEAQDSGANDSSEHRPCDSKEQEQPTEKEPSIREKFLATLEGKQKGDIVPDLLTSTSSSTGLDQISSSAYSTAGSRVHQSAPASVTHQWIHTGVNIDELRPVEEWVDELEIQLSKPKKLRMAASAPAGPNAALYSQSRAPLQGFQKSSTVQGAGSNVATNGVSNPASDVTIGKRPPETGSLRSLKANQTTDAVFSSGYSAFNPNCAPDGVNPGLSSLNSMYNDTIVGLMTPSSAGLGRRGSLGSVGSVALSNIKEEPPEISPLCSSETLSRTTTYTADETLTNLVNPRSTPDLRRLSQTSVFQTPLSTPTSRNNAPENRSNALNQSGLNQTGTSLTNSAGLDDSRSEVSGSSFRPSLTIRERNDRIAKVGSYGESRTVEVGGQRLDLLFTRMNSLGKDTIRVFPNSCPHQGQPLVGGEIELKDIEDLGRIPVLRCRFHNKRFKLSDGKCHPQGAEKDLPLFENITDGSGYIWIKEKIAKKDEPAPKPKKKLLRRYNGSIT